MMRARLFATVLLTVVAAAGAKAKEDTTSTRKRSGYVFIPALYYTPETESAGGAVVMFYFRPKSSPDDVKPSTITPTLIFTQREQVIVDLGASIYFDDGRYWLTAGVSFQRYPDKFWGIGPDTNEEAEEDFTPRTFAVGGTLRRSLREGLSVGASYEFSNDEITEVQEDGDLATGMVDGSAGAVVSGVGLAVSWDTRDNTFYATRGSFHQASVRWFGSALGSDYDYVAFNADVRKYVALGPRTVLALQGVYAGVDGTAPFRLLPQFGGPSLVRGYWAGRYRDNHTAVGQVDLRVKIGWHVGAIAFGSVGNVAPRLDAFRSETIRATGGFGVRYFFNETEGVSARADFAFGGNAMGPYIYINEAF